MIDGRLSELHMRRNGRLMLCQFPATMTENVPLLTTVRMNLKASRCVGSSLLKVIIKQVHQSYIGSRYGTCQAWPLSCSLQTPDVLPCTIIAERDIFNKGAELWGDLNSVERL